MTSTQLFVSDGLEENWMVLHNLSFSDKVKSATGVPEFNRERLAAGGHRRRCRDAAWRGMWRGASGGGRGGGEPGRVEVVDTRISQQAATIAT